jgi:hypothetical protein
MEQYAYNTQATLNRSSAQAIALPLAEDNLSLSESALLMTALFTLISSIMAIAIL